MQHIAALDRILTQKFAIICYNAACIRVMAKNLARGRDFSRLSNLTASF